MATVNQIHLAAVRRANQDCIKKYGKPPIAFTSDTPEAQYWRNQYDYYHAVAEMSDYHNDKIQGRA